VNTESKSVKSLYISSGDNGSLLVTSLNLPDDPEKDPNNKAKLRVLQVKSTEYPRFFSSRWEQFFLCCSAVRMLTYVGHWECGKWNPVRAERTWLHLYSSPACSGDTTNKILQLQTRALAVSYLTS
jgi:hypothetical protein